MPSEDGCAGATAVMSTFSASISALSSFSCDEILGGSLPSSCEGVIVF